MTGILATGLRELSGVRSLGLEQRDGPGHMNAHLADAGHFSARST
jgi:hypothetical protein